MTTNTTNEVAVENLAYLGCEWENNYYNDSDFQGAFLNKDTGEVFYRLIGSTRFAGDIKVSSPLATEAEIAQALEWSIPVAARCYQNEHEYRIRRTTNLDGVHDLRLLNDVEFKDKRTNEVTKARAGEVGKIIWKGAFGKFYHNGAKKLNRRTIRVGLRFPDGRVVFTKLENTCVDVDPLTTVAAEEKARLNARNSAGYWQSILQDKPNKENV